MTLMLFIVLVAWIPAIYFFLLKILYDRAGAAYDAATGAYMRGDREEGERWSELGALRHRRARIWDCVTPGRKTP